MALDYSQAGSHVRTKLADSPGAFADDPDIADPTVNLPATILSGVKTTLLAWRAEGRKTNKVKVKVTFREDDGTEIAGTFTVYGFVIVPLCAAEEALSPDPLPRPAIEKHGDAFAGASAVHMVFNEIGVNDYFGVVLTDITAALATKAFIRIEEVADAA